MIYVRFVIMLFLAAGGFLSARGQGLWPGTSSGMTLEEVQRTFPNAHAPENPVGLPHGRGAELLQIDQVAVAGRTFSVHFFFKDRLLVQVALADTGTIALKDFEKVRDIMRKRYNHEYSTTNTGEYILVTWKIAQSTVVLTWTPQGHGIATLAVTYEAPILKDSEKI